VSELVEAMLFIWSHAATRVSVHNIAPERGATSVRHIAEQVVATVAPDAAIRYGSGAKGWVGDVPVFGYDTSRLASLGWRPTLTSDAAVARAVLEIAAERWP
jgi:UDP-glucose 4-epimerase